MSRASGRLLILPPIALLIALSLACNGGDSVENRLTTGGGSTCVNFRELIPADWQLVGDPIEIQMDWDSNGDGRPDKLWLLFYRFDIPCDGPSPCSPIKAVVYRPSGHRPAHLIPYPLPVPEDGYLCESKCSASWEEVVPPPGEAPPGEPELLIWDRADGEVKRLTVFQWITPTEAAPPQIYEYVGRFIGDRISLNRESGQVTVDERLPPVLLISRSQLATRKVYRLHPGERGAWEWREVSRELICYCGMPCDATLSPYPEKVVLAFYSHYPNAMEMRPYFTDAGWERVGGCWNGQCGCSLPREQVERVRVVELQPGGAVPQGEAIEQPTPLPEGVSPAEVPPPVGEEVPTVMENTVLVLTGVICEPACADEAPTYVMWTLVRDGHRWLLDDAEVLGQMPPEGPLPTTP